MLDVASIDRALDKAALRYLERFDSSTANLRRVLGRKAQALIAEGIDRQLLSDRIDELLQRYQRSSLLDDARYAAAVIRGLRERGLGERAIVARLSAKGVGVSVTEIALAAVDEHTREPELEAARRYVKRRRLGVYRGTAASSKTQRKDLQALARAGFGYAIAARALAVETPDEDTTF